MFSRLLTHSKAQLGSFCRLVKESAGTLKTSWVSGKFKISQKIAERITYYQQNRGKLLKDSALTATTLSVVIAPVYLVMSIRLRSEDCTIESVRYSDVNILRSKLANRNAITLQEGYNVYEGGKGFGNPLPYAQL